ncbi:SprT-like family-domain-containing protein [Phaeosphaeria sp. MPI-PUGE-AT-0046c]|nr:SprT-like family-domain-containing protein [Phaeosphaeria sp. MPI-PUGE-AT-0046c]
MARLRKPSPDEPIFRPSTTTRATRSSPRKPARSVQYTESSDEENVVLVPKRSTLDLRNDSLSQDADDSFFTSRSIMSTGLTPRKQRILRPMESNSRLLRKISDESLASPEKRRRERRERTRATEDHIGTKSRQLYAKTLARSVTKKTASNTKTDAVADAELRDIPWKSVEEEDTQMNEVQEDVETSLWCGDEKKDQEDEETTSEVEVSDEEDDDPVVHTRQRKQGLPARRIISDSDSDDSSETPPSEFAHSSGGHSGPETLPQVIPKGPAPENLQPLTSMRPPHRKGHSTISSWAQEVIDLTDSPEPTTSFAPPTLPEPTRMRSASFASSRPETSSSSHGGLAILTYSPTPTKRRSPCKAPPIARSGTPPLAPPSPTKLVSPSKKKPTITKVPILRPSLDAFWDPEVVNNHNDLHSPSKPLVSPRKQKWRDDIVKMMEEISLEDDGNQPSDPPSPTVNPRTNKTTEKTKPSKSTKKPAPTSNAADPSMKALRAQRKAFAASKDSLASSFLAQLDETLTSGQVSALCAPTGGIKLIWSSTLKTTAGRANWRREQVRIRNGPLATDFQTTIRHHCSIELATKVIDDSTRLYNVLAHEFCHLATFMISGVRNNPHGKEFKSWGSKCSSAFSHLDVEVTTKHSYAIDYKFVWECVDCGYEFKRHSKSVDANRHSCGKCKGRLVQTKPTPRQGGQSGYQAFVKGNYARVKGEMEKRGEETGMSKVVEQVAKEYREMKEREGKKEESDKAGDALDDVMGSLKI